MDCVLSRHWHAMLVQVASAESKIYGILQDTQNGGNKFGGQINRNLLLGMVRKGATRTNQIDCVYCLVRVADHEIQWLHIMDNQTTRMHVFEAIQLNA